MMMMMNTVRERITNYDDIVVGWDLRGWFGRLLVSWVGGKADTLWKTGWRDRRAIWLTGNGQAWPIPKIFESAHHFRIKSERSIWI